jgi:hypothetical protein
LPLTAFPGAEKHLPRWLSATAWAIVKAGGLELAVKGVSFGNRQEALKRLAKYSPDQIKAVLVPEPENPADQRNRGYGWRSKRPGLVPAGLCTTQHDCGYIRHAEASGSACTFRRYLRRQIGGCYLREKKHDRTSKQN